MLGTVLVRYGGDAMHIKIKNFSEEFAVIFSHHKEEEEEKKKENGSYFVIPPCSVSDCVYAFIVFKCTGTCNLFFSASFHFCLIHVQFHGAAKCYHILAAAVVSIGVVKNTNTTNDNQ